MKKCIQLTLLIILFFSFKLEASHINGGEITWKCKGNGEFEFYIKLYRNCNGIPLGSSQYDLHVIGNAGVTNITCYQIAVNDLTPVGCGNSCGSPNGFGGAVEEHIYKSNPVFLSGTPPATGWAFYWDGECCRNAVDNLVSGGQMVLRSVMYPLPSSAGTNPCYDSSPEFMEKPESFICIGANYFANAAVLDADHDSLSFAFDYALENGGSGSGLGTVVNFQAPYSVNSPMPGNPVLNAATGRFDVAPPNGAQAGDYAIITKVTAYRCGVKIAEVFREVQVALSASGCLPVGPGGTSPNSPPQINPAPFIDPSTGLYTSYTDTVLVGDTVMFTLSITEFETNLTSGNFQHFYIDAYGAEMDSGSVFPYVDCRHPPCAYLNFATPQGPITLGTQLIFNWITDCATDVNAACYDGYTTHYFNIKVTDDACPSRGINNKTVTIVIRGLYITQSNDTLTAHGNLTNYQWYLNGVAISGATSNTYVASGMGTYTVQGIAASGCIIYSDRLGYVITDSKTEQEFITSLRVYPNPVSTLVHVNLQSQKAGNTEFKITDQFGHVVVLQTQKLTKGNNTFSIPTNGLQNGVYYLSVSDKTTNYQARFVVLK